MDLKMEATATDSMVFGLVSRLERDGHHLTPKAVEKIHAIITYCMPDLRAEGNQKMLCELVKDRVIRDDR